jgi:NAD(P)-dependent dehydrogenase (short-subunit alcohol dehydrogenase family)
LILTEQPDQRCFANLVAFLASYEAAFINGATIGINGGRVMM